MAAVDPATLAKLSDEKKQLVVDTISSKCVDDSPFEDLRMIGAALKGGEKLEIKILTGGLANYSYKLWTSNVSIYAKLTFPFAQLFPDKPFPLSRTTCEFEMIKKYDELSPGSVATPFYCLDVEDNQGPMKLLVTAWAKADEQFGNQFIDGVVDVRTAKAAASGISAVHSCEFDPDFNKDLKPAFQTSFVPIFYMVMDGIMKKEVDDRVSTYGKEYTQAKLDLNNKIMEEKLQVTECLTHGDFHPFNIMVGKKPSAATLERFDAFGGVIVCDFEMSCPSFAGKDLGQFLAFPYSCVFAHTLNGTPSAAQNILDFIDTFWKEYDTAIDEKGQNTETSKAKNFRDSLLMLGIYMLAYYGLNVHMNYLPIDEGNVEDLTKVKESIGMIGLKSYLLGTSNDKVDMSLADLRAGFQSWIEEEMTILGTKRRPSRRGRRSSMLRAAGLQVSDSHMHVPNMDRASFVSMNRASFRGLEISEELAAELLVEYDDIILQGLAWKLIPIETVLHVQNFRVELPTKAKKLGFEELNPQQVASDLFANHQPGDKVAIISRFPKHVQGYQEAKGLKVRILEDQSGIQDFCFLLRAQYQNIGTAMSTYATFAGMLWEMPNKFVSTLWIAKRAVEDVENHLLISTIPMKN